MLNVFNSVSLTFALKHGGCHLGVLLIMLNIVPGLMSRCTKAVA